MQPILPIIFKMGHLGHYNKVRHLYWTTENIPKAILLYYIVSQNLCRKLVCLFWNLYDLLYHFYSLLPYELQRMAAEKHHITALRTSHWNLNRNRYRISREFLSLEILYNIIERAFGSESITSGTLGQI